MKDFGNLSMSIQSFPDITSSVTTGVKSYFFINLLQSLFTYNFSPTLTVTEVIKKITNCL